MFEFILLGTGAMKPTPRRFTSSFVLRHNGNVILFDAGEGIQVRIAQSDFSVMKIDKIFLTHFHGDHCYGLPGIIFTMKNSERKRPLTIYGPRGVEAFVRKILSLGGKLPFEVRPVEISPGDVVPGDGHSITVFPVEHGTVAQGYIFKEDDSANIDKSKMERFKLKPHPKFKLLKQGQTVEIDGITLNPDDWLVPVPGDSLAYTGDTSYSKKVASSVRGATVLLHDSTWLSSDSESPGEHSTSMDAARIAGEANVKFLILNHISSRYPDPKPLLEEARGIFPQTILPDDLDRFTVKRGELIRK